MKKPCSADRSGGRSPKRERRLYRLTSHQMELLHCPPDDVEYELAQARLAQQVKRDGCVKVIRRW